jgi:hypothetical protein
MEATAFFERKVGLTPRDISSLKSKTVNDILKERLAESIENKCSEHGFVLPGSLEIISRSMGYFEQARFTGDAVYYVKAKGQVLYPADGIRVTGEVIRKNKLGLYVVHRDALRIQIPRDLHIGNEEFDSVEIGDTVEVEIKKSRFQVNDPFVLTNGLFVGKREEGATVVMPPPPPAAATTITGTAVAEGADAKEDEDDENDEEDEDEEGDDEEGGDEEGDDEEGGDEEGGDEDEDEEGDDEEGDEEA